MDFREMQKSLLIKATKAHFCQNIEKMSYYSKKNLQKLEVQNKNRQY